MDSHTSYTKTTLPNGVRLILVPMTGVNSVASAVMVAAGSRYETPAINGISHFLEHMVFKGTKKYPTTDDVNVVERQGGLQNAYTDIDITNYHNKVLASDWELGLEINKELAIHPLLEQTHVDKERDVILEEMKRYEDEPAAKVGEVFHHMMYPDTRLGMRIIGEEKSLRSVAAHELKVYHDRWYAPKSIVVAVAGALAHEESNIQHNVETWFGKLKKKPVSDFERVTDEQGEPKVTVVTKPDANQAHLTLGLRTFPRGSEDRFAWSLFNLIMGVSFTSRLFKEVREKRGLCYAIRSSQDAWKDVGYWSIYAGVATEKVSEAVKAIVHELQKACDAGVKEEELRVAKKRLKTLFAFQSENPEFMGEYYGRQELFGEPIISIDDYIARIDGVTASDIDKLVKRYLVTHHLNLALVWNKTRDEKLLDLLQI
jgi:predicted Zn-dependent peptidase